MAAVPESAQSTSFLLDGRTVDALPGETILQAARRHGVDIPHLCYKDGLRPDGNCRACVVEVKGERSPGSLVLPDTAGGHGGGKHE